MMRSILLLLLFNLAFSNPVIADDAIFQNRFLKGENEKLADNLRRWMSHARN